jgi:DUF971 family protein
VSAVEPFDVTEVVIDRERSRLEVGFDDGVVASLPLDFVRQACPCATCRGRREAGHEAWQQRPGAAPLSVLGAELSGAWGLSIQWSDGHDTGIYPWASLRRWAAES